MKWRNLNSKYINPLEKLKSLDPYQRLEIKKCASIKQVKLAYRKKMRIYHPDKIDVFFKKHATEMVKLFNEAYEQIKKELNNG